VLYTAVDKPRELDRLQACRLIPLYPFTLHARLLFDRADEEEYQEVEVPATVLGYTMKHLTPGVTYRFQGQSVCFERECHLASWRPRP